MRHALMDQVDNRPIVIERIRTPHRRQDAVARVLERQMEMRRKAAVACSYQLNDRWRAVHRLERADAKNDIRIDAFECFQQIEQSHGCRQVASIRSQMDACEYD